MRELSSPTAAQVCTLDFYFRGKEGVSIYHCVPIPTLATNTVLSLHVQNHMKRWNFPHLNYERFCKLPTPLSRIVAITL